MTLSRFETFLYFGIWIGGVAISLYHLYLVGRVFNNNLHDEYHSDDFRKGWRILGERYQDQADYEWNSWTKLTWNLLPFLVCNLAGAEFIRNSRKINLLPLWYTFVTFTYLLYQFNIIICLWFVSLIFIYYICLLFGSYLLIWTVTFLLLHFQPEFWFVTNEDEQYLILISSSWIMLRCISFCTDKFCHFTKSELSFGKHVSEVILMLGYSFYLPTMFCGPFLLFSYFNKGLNLEFEEWNFKRFLGIAIKLLRCAMWYLFTQFSLHFIYVNAILLRPHLVKQLFDWELAGLGIAMGHFFHLKYIVFYGIPCAWAAAERFVTPDIPCCVSRIHLYSYMWRRFDHGLYKFLIKYIYIPVISAVKGNSLLKKTAASIACFSFVFAWHGEENHVFYWVLFNFMAVTIETLGKKLFHISKINKFCVKNMSPKNILRVQCLLTAPLHYFSMISNYFFIGNGMEIGLVYLNKFLYGSLRSTLIVLFFLYGAGQSAVATQIWEEKHKAKKKLC